MGTNGSFPPPPPPPGQPGFQPTQQVPTTQAYPQQGVPVAAAPKKGNGLLIGGGLVVVAAIVGGIVLLTGGDDDKKTTTITLAPNTSATVVADTTVPATAIITTPPTVAPTDAPTVPPTSVDDGLIEVFDDTGTFSMILPNDLEVDTTAVTDPDGVTVPSISAAEIIADYYVNDTTFGLTAVAVGPDIGSTAEQVMAFFEPPEGTCAGRSVEIGRPTAIGAANVVTLTGCGVGAGNKVLMVVQLADKPVVVGIYMQGLATIENLAPAAQYALESILVF